MLKKNWFFELRFKNKVGCSARQNIRKRNLFHLNDFTRKYAHASEHLLLVWIFKWRDVPRGKHLCEPMRRNKSQSEVLHGYRYVMYITNIILYSWMSSCLTILHNSVFGVIDTFNIALLDRVSHDRTVWAFF